MTRLIRGAARVVMGIAVAWSVHACDDDPIAPTTGWIQVQATTTGTGTDADGYTVAVDGGASVGIAVDGTLTIPGVQPGARSVELGGLDATCSVTSANPTSATVVAGDTAAVSFSVACTAAPTTGTVVVRTATTGDSIDADGYSVAVGADTLPIGVTDTVAFTDVAVGDQTVSLGGVAANCSVADSATRTATIAGGDTATVDFAVTCQAPVQGSGTVIVTTATTGDSIDADGYVASIGSDSMAVAVTDTITFMGVAAGENSVLLSGIAANCSVADSATRTATITGSDTASVDFQVTCQAPAQPTFGDWIAFTTDRDGNDEIYLVMPDGTGAVNLTVNAAVDGDAAWAPDSTRIAFRSDRDGDGEIYIINADGTGIVQVTTNDSNEHSPAWSPDGTQLAFVSDRDGNEEVYVANTDGSAETNITNDSTAADKDPAWSPSGTLIAFTTDRDGNNEIYTVAPDGTGAANVSNDSTGGDWAAAWSPDGTQIAFATDRDGNNEVYVMASDGTGATNLTNDAGADDFPAWSVDGTQIVFVTDRDGNNELYVMAADGTGATNLTNDAGSDRRPAWGRAAR